MQFLLSELELSNITLREIVPPGVQIVLLMRCFAEIDKKKKPNVNVQIRLFAIFFIYIFLNSPSPPLA